MSKDKNDKTPPAPGGFRLDFVGLEKGQAAPKVEVHAVDRAFKTIATAKVDAEGQFALPDKAVADANLIVVGPEGVAPTAQNKDKFAILRPAELQKALAAKSAINIPGDRWAIWIPFKRCVSGSVKHCFPFPWFVRDIALKAAVVDFTAPTQEPPLFQSRAAALLGRKAQSVLTDVQLGIPDLLIPPFPHRCETVCNGLVEVYKRHCCCVPIVIDVPKINQLIGELEKLVAQPPIIKWPPGPDPGPEDLVRAGLLKEGSLDERAINARRDLQALRSLPVAEARAYIESRPYLHWPFCTCSKPAKVAEGLIHPDGTFSICWVEPFPFPFPINCHDEYAFVVKQVLNGSTIVIYNGLAAGIWLNKNTGIELDSYDPRAKGCRHNDFPDTGAFTLLELIGITDSYNLKTPDATGAYSVAAPAYNDGLSFPAANAAAAKGLFLDRNWGGSLGLRYHFSEPMKAVGAKYYRISVIDSDASGNPTGTRTYLSDAVSWSKYVVAFPDVLVVPEVLGPNSVGGEANLFVIPYDADGDWVAGQFHGVVNTDGAPFTDGRHLITVEVFDATGKLLRPTGTPDPNPGHTLEAAFTYRRWFQPVGPTAVVPFAALTHMFWWDNRRSQAQIVDLRVNGVPNMAECQFLKGPGGNQFSVGYRAYHPVEAFQLYHNMWWHRGLGGSNGSLVTSDPNNVGVPPGPPGVSGSDTFTHMLGTNTSCSFAVNLSIAVKTFDGIGRLSGLDSSDQAAFAIEIA